MSEPTGDSKLIYSLLQPAAANLQVINSITINSLSLFFDNSAPWAPMFSTNDTVATFQLPFAFPVRSSILAHVTFSDALLYRSTSLKSERASRQERAAVVLPLVSLSAHQATLRRWRFLWVQQLRTCKLERSSSLSQTYLSLRPTTAPSPRSFSPQRMVTRYRWVSVVQPTVRRELEECLVIDAR